MWNAVMSLFQSYMGSGLIIGWFLLALVWLLVTEKRTERRILFGYVPVVLLLLYFNPLVAKVVYAFAGDEIYYRILWLLPVTMVLAYSMVQLCAALQGKAKAVFAGVCVILCMVSGNYVYDNVYFHKAENIYHVPDSVVHICDAIKVDGREVMAAFPTEMIQYVRQYSPVVCMPYGREQTVERWNRYDELYALLQEDVIDTARMVPLSRERYCHYIIVPQGTPFSEDVEEYDFILFDTIDGYDIYQDLTIYIGL